MTRLRLYIDPVEESTLDALVVEVRQAKSRPQRVVVPVGERASPIVVEPGRVLIEARLPSGRSIITDTVVEGDEASVTLSIAPPVPVVRGTTAFESLPITPVTSPGSTGDEPALSAWHGVDRGGVLEHIVPLGPGRSTPDDVRGIGRAGAEWRICLGEGGGDDRGRRFIAFLAPTEARVVFLPLPWPSSASGGRAAIELLVQPAGRPDEPPLVKLRLRDRELGPLVAYLHGGDLGSAREVAAGLAEHRLWGKESHPLGATIGGYALLALREYERLHDWPRNLWQRFTWLPDGAIIWATLLLRRGGDIAETAQALLQAGERGVPFFSTGVRLLVDGLRAVLASRAHRGDEKLTRALTRADRLALLVDPDAPATSLVGSWPELDEALGWNESQRKEASQ